MGTDPHSKNTPEADQQYVKITYRYLAKPTPAQSEQLHRYAAGYRTVYNLTVAYRKRNGHGSEDGFSAARPGSKWFTAQKDLTFTAKLNNGAWKQYGYTSVANSVLRRAAKEVHEGYLSYRDLKRGGHSKAKPPYFKSAKRSPISFKHQVQSNAGKGVVNDWVRAGPNRRLAAVRLPQPRDKRFKSDAWVKVRYHRPVPEHALIGEAHWNFDRTRRCWHVSLVLYVPVTADVSAPPEHPVVVGVDRGIAVPAYAVSVDTASGQVAIALDSPRQPADAHLLQRLRRLERKFARQHHQNSPECFIDGAHIEGSCRWTPSKRAQETKKQIAGLRAKIARQRRNQIEHLTNDITHASIGSHPADVIALEKLNVKSMMKSAKGTTASPGTNVKAKQGLNREIANVAWSTLQTRLLQKARRAALEGRTVTVVEVPARNTSRCCPECGHTSAGNRRGTSRTFKCEACGYRNHADFVGALNIARRAIALPAETAGRP